MSPIAVVVFAKAPRAGAVKTRLCPPLSPAAAARLSRCFLLDALDRVQALSGVTPAVAYAPRSARPFFAAARPGMMLVPQGGGDLGARMARVVERLLGRGFAAVLVLGTDSPTLPRAHLRAAVRLLGRADADGVIGPSEDGGYYLIGLRAPCPALFTGVAWGTSRVLAQTLARARRAGRRLRLLPRWYDVDTLADLRRLAAELRRPRGPAPRTRRLLATRAWRAWALSPSAASPERPTAAARQVAGVRSGRPARRRWASTRRPLRRVALHEGVALDHRAAAPGARSARLLRARHRHPGASVDGDRVGRGDGGHGPDRA